MGRSLPQFPSCWSCWSCGRQHATGWECWAQSRPLLHGLTGTWAASQPALCCQHSLPHPCSLVSPTCPRAAPLLCCSLHGELHGHPRSSHTALLCCNHRHSLQAQHTPEHTCTYLHTHSHTSTQVTQPSGHTPVDAHMPTWAPSILPLLYAHTHTHTHAPSPLSLAQLPTTHCTSPPPLTQPQHCPHSHGHLQPSSPISLIPSAPFAFPDGC